jgi:uncharacterized membrane protein
MDPVVQEIANLVLRWLHVLTGIAWVGYAYFLLLSWSQVSLQLAEPVRKAVAPLLIQKVLPFFRVVAVLTWVTGLLLLGLVYHHGKLMVGADGGSAGMAIGVGMMAMLFAFFFYDGLYKSPLAAMGPAAGAVATLLFAGLAFGLSKVMTGRAMFIHLGSTLGTIMLMNAAMRLAPAQQKFIKMLKDELPFDPRVPALVGQRTAHNVVLSVAVVAFMLSFHAPSAYGHDLAWAIAAGIGLVCFAGTRALVDALAPPPPPRPAA